MSLQNFDPQLNIMLIHSVDQRMPLYYRILPGNIREVKASYDEIAEGSEKLLYVIYRLHKSKCFKWTLKKCDVISLPFTCKSEEKAGSAAEQPASNMICRRG